MKVGIIPNFTREKTLDVFKDVICNLEKFNIEYCFDSESLRTFPISIDASKGCSDLYETSDLIIVIGGDGSFIHAAKDAAVHKKPVLCINAGNLAFLAGLEGNELDLLKNLISGDYVQDRRMMLEVVLKTDSKEKLLGYCLNDVVIARYGDIKLIDLDVFCNGRKINNYRGDGVVISTPTGSTAYAWSAGGPVIDPDLKCITVTPICTHSPLNRTLVFNEESVITVKASNNLQRICLSTDGDKSLELNDSFEIIVKESNYYAEFIRIKSDEFFDILNSKLTQRRI
ncbi:MAG: NAD(+)/NADH kinase [Clostridia bacterium]|nr:NAD(+)/NADH kinase [Clostridia bacterium]